MKVTIEPGKVNGSIAAPPSKSMTQRAYAAALLHTGRTMVNFSGRSEDEQAALRVIQQLGADVTTRDGGAVEIQSGGVRPTGNSIDCGESGLCARLFTPIAALGSVPISIEGTGTLLKRPMDGIEGVLKELNVSLPGFNRFLPFEVQGPLRARTVKINAGDSSQFLSGLLFAMSSCLQEAVAIKVSGLKSRPYIDMTIDVLGHFGKIITHNNYREFYIAPATFTQKELVEIDIEGDWSSAANMLVAGAIAGEITVQNLNIASKQADRAILDVLASAGADVAAEGKYITAKRAGRLRAFEFDATHCPDLFPILAVLAGCCDGESCIRGVHRLFHKESNRVESITEMLQDFAIHYSVEDDTLFVTGEPKLQGTVIDSYRDHRIVMAAAVGALRANGPVEISDAEVVNKSYPDFFKDLNLCGGNCNFIEQL